jgi:inorganic phosphate transporter, PiT family
VEIFGDLSSASLFFLILALGLALSFEFVNGFHDTANAVATVIYTHTLKPTYAVVWSGIWNLIGVLTSSGAVAFGIIALLPVELVINVGSGAGFAMVFALLISAILWNLGTWYFGLPASSSHTLIGSIMGVGLANSMLSAGHVFGEGVNWAKAKEVGLSLLISPIVGFVCAGLLLIVAKKLIKGGTHLFEPPPKDQPPPPWIRGLLMLTCTGVSFAHGSNDGQKGMGLMMLILIGILPATYALNLNTEQAQVQQIVSSSTAVSHTIEEHDPGHNITGEAATEELSSYLKTTGVASEKTFASLAGKSAEIAQELIGKTSFKDVGKEERRGVRSNFYLVVETINKLNKGKKFTKPEEASQATAYKALLEQVTKFIPNFIKVAIAIALGLGTMIGWKRIVVTVGEKIGKEHLTYAQGGAAELTAMCTILAADNYGLPVSTTHVLSSGIAGTMAANHSGLQMDTLRNLLLAWVLTLPVCVLLGAGTFSAGLYIVFNILGLK